MEKSNKKLNFLPFYVGETTLLNSIKKLFTLWACWLTVSVNAVDSKVSQHLQEVSVTIKSGGSQGSGVIFTREDKDGSKINLVWTAAHVIDNLRREREIITPNGIKRIMVEFDDPKIVKVLIEDGRTIGQLELHCQVIKYSDSRYGHDLALLMVRKKNFIKEGVVFYLEDKIPELGTEVIHVGSLLGVDGANSLTTGVLSQRGRLIGKMVFDQFSCPAFPGSSGGIVANEHGQYLSMLVRGAGETFVLGIPIRRIKEWCKKESLEWAIDSTKSMPNLEEIENIPIEDKAKILSTGDAKELKTIPTLIKKANGIVD